MKHIDLKNRIINYNKLIDYGFIKNNDKYIYETLICSNSFKVLIIIDITCTSKVIDNQTNEEYLLVDINTSGNYVGKVKEEYENIINDFIENCTYLEIFKNKQSKEIIKYIKNKYNDELEFLWKDLDCAIWRNKKNKKWYGLLMKITKDKLGLKSNEEIEIINVQYPKEYQEQIVDNKTVFKAYHMNKQRWISIILDSNIKTYEIFNLIDQSYNISGGKK